MDICTCKHLKSGHRKRRGEVKTVYLSCCAFRCTCQAFKVDKASDIPDDVLLLPSEAAAVFRVDPKTVTRWAIKGTIACVRTGGGHRRYRGSEVKRVLAAPPDSAIAVQP